MRFEAICALAAVLLCVTDAAAQRVGRSEAELQLEVTRAQLDEQNAAEIRAQKRKLYDEGLLSAAELKAAETEYSRARLLTASAQIALTNELPTFIVMSASKSLNQNGEPRLQLTLRSLPSDLSSIPRRYLVSVSSGGTIIGEPYQTEVVTPPKGQTFRLSFRLLKDADEVSVMIVSGTKREEIPIVLQRASAGSNFTLRCPTPSQQAGVGDRVDYAIQLDRFGGGSNVLVPTITALPAEFAWDLVDPQSHAKLTQLLFPEGRDTLSLVLRIYIPAQLASLRSYDFSLAVATVDGRVVASAPLQLRTAGVPKLAISSDNFLISMDTMRPQTVALTLENEGTATARNVYLESVAPVGVGLRFAPESIAQIQPHERRPVELTLRALPDCVPGEYALKVAARMRDRFAESEPAEQTYRLLVSESIGRRTVVALLAICVVAAAAGYSYFRRRAHG